MSRWVAVSCVQCIGPMAASGNLIASPVVKRPAFIGRAFNGILTFWFMFACHFLSWQLALPTYTDNGPGYTHPDLLLLLCCCLSMQVNEFWDHIAHSVSGSQATLERREHTLTEVREA